MLWSTIGELVLCGLTGWRLWSLRPRVTGTTLVDAWRWSWGVVALAVVTAVVRSATDRPFPVGDCGLAVAAMIPQVAVLGARRPTNRVWTPFVVLPMVIVLLWPVIMLVLRRGWFVDAALETPSVVAYELVVVMACGNYFGTRLTVASLAWGAVCSALLIAHATITPQWWPLVDEIRIVAGIVGVISLSRAASVWSPHDVSLDPFDRLWFDVLDHFGIVWARRLQERLNAVGRQQQWPAKLDIDGWHWQQSATDEQRAEMEHACRWLLRRFVDPPWIDARLGTTATEATPLRMDS